MEKFVKYRIVGLLSVLCLLSANINATGIGLVKTDDALQWVDMPNSAGKYTILAGDPKKSGVFVVRVKFPPNYAITPHHHNNYEYDTVISGSCYIAKGRVVTKKNGLLAKAGTFVSIPPQIMHYGWTGAEGAVIQLSGMGPWSPKYE